jgi:Superfamily II DNA and RNA helicases
MAVKFADFGFIPEVQSALDSIGFEQPTPIQEQAIPAIQKGSDLIACAQTGTGKTAAFVLPILDKLSRRPGGSKGVNTLILVPTRELAVQIDMQLEGFSYFCPVSSLSVYGGGDGSVWEQQRSGLSGGADIVVATPGRILAHMAFSYVDFSNLEHLILDEADRMLDMGFHDDIMSVVKQLPVKRQTLLFSATMPDKIRKLAKKILHSPEEINISPSKPSENVLQACYLVEDSQKPALVKRLLADKKEIKSVIIFCSTKSKVRLLDRELRLLGLSAKAIHSDLEQNEREEVLRQFRGRKFQLMVATDIISRGIDIDQIDLVVNYDVPHDADDYVHRIGRTARAEADGVAITLVTKAELRNFKKIESFLGQKIFQIPLPADL